MIIIIIIVVSSRSSRSGSHASAASPCYFASFAQYVCLGFQLVVILLLFFLTFSLLPLTLSSGAAPDSAGFLPVVLIVRTSGAPE